jgi:hypothetical protein
MPSKGMRPRTHWVLCALNVHLDHDLVVWTRMLQQPHVDVLRAHRQPVRVTVLAAVLLLHDAGALRLGLGRVYVKREVFIRHPHRPTDVALVRTPLNTSSG